MKETTILNEVTTKELDTFLRKVAYNKRNVVMISQEDLVQELWVTALETIERLGRIDYGYISKACNYKTVNIVRSNIKNEYLPFGNSEFERCVDSSYSNHKKGSSEQDKENHSYSYISNHKFMTPEENFDFKTILEIFDEETEEKERSLITGWMEVLGLKELDNEEDYSKLPKTADQNYVAVNMGYASSRSNGYYRIRNKVIAKLIENGYSL